MAKRKAKDPRVKQELRKRRTGMILSFFMICLLILLSSSFILRYIYRGAANVSITPEGVSEVYQTATGQTNFNVIEPDEEYEFTYDDSYTIEDEDNYSNNNTNRSNSNNNSNNYNSSNSKDSDYNSNQSNSQGYTDGTGVYNNSSNNSNNSGNNSNNSNSNNSGNNSNNSNSTNRNSNN